MVYALYTVEPPGKVTTQQLSISLYGIHRQLSITFWVPVTYDKSEEFKNSLKWEWIKDANLGFQMAHLTDCLL